VFKGVGLHVRVEVQVHFEHISGGVVGAADGCELDVALVFALGPIHDVVLPVDTELETRNRETLKHAPLPVAGEGQALAMKEVELRVQRPVGDIRDFAQAPEWGLVHQELENQPVLVRLLLSDGRATYREGLGAGAATVAFGAGVGGAIAATVGRSGGDTDAVILTLGIVAEVDLDPAVLGRNSGVEPPEDVFCTE
jgi:hypothetical protein